METNFLVTGSGIAGLTFALEASKKGHVILVTKGKMSDSSTNLAQGGIAGVIAKEDTFKKHFDDTMKAGSYHNDKKAVTFLVKNSSKAVRFLADLGVPFQKKAGTLLLAKEGGHSVHRVAFTSDQTGRDIETTLIKKVLGNKKIEVIENAFALDLIMKNKKCYGATVLKNNKIENIFANYTALATGGIGQLYAKTTNPLVATGDGIAMAIQAKAKVEDMEFVQFHPTAFDSKESPLFLISETVRGEGAKLLNYKGERFIDELAPRDVVAREIYKQQKKGKVYLDITSKSKEFLRNRFHGIYKHLKKHGFSMEKDKIPITPVAHYLCGGIKTDLNGKTSIKNLLAFGECTCTGVQGANRLASNSLLEGVVFPLNSVKKIKVGKIQTLKLKNPTAQKPLKQAKILKQEIKKIMWQYAGITRDLKDIKNKAIPRIQKILKELSQGKNINNKTKETANMAITSLCILKASCARKKSLGCHFIEKA